LKVRPKGAKFTAFELFDKIIPGIDEWVEVSTLSIDNKAFDKGWEEGFNQPREYLDEITNLLDEAVNLNEEKYDSKRTFVLTNISIGLILLLAILTFIGYVVIKDISNPLVSLVGQIKEIEKGHLKICQRLMKLIRLH
jgi:hypothetical protein